MTEAEGKSSAIKKTTVIACNRFVFVCLPVQPLDGDARNNLYLCCAQCQVPLCPITTNPQHRLSYEQTILFMSRPTAHPTASSANFQPIINNALDKYKKRTRIDLLTHPLAAQLQSCNSSSDILAVLQQQVQDLDQSQITDERWTRWLVPTVNVFYAHSSTLAMGVSLVCLRTRTCL